MSGKMVKGASSAMKTDFNPSDAQFGDKYDFSHLTPVQIMEYNIRLRRRTPGCFILQQKGDYYMVAKRCHCGKIHAGDNGWTVVRNNSHNARLPYKVYLRDCPADAAHFSADLAPFTHKSERLARLAGAAGHMAYLTMHHIYIGSGSTPDKHAACKAALEKRYPHLTFDCEVVEGVSGVRFHTTKYDLDSPLMIELRTFCRNFLQQNTETHEVAQ